MQKPGVKFQTKSKVKYELIQKSDHPLKVGVQSMCPLCFGFFSGPAMMRPI